MPSRREFLKIAGITALSTGSGLNLLSGCAGGIASYRGQPQSGTLEIPKMSAVTLSQPNGLLLVQAAQHGSIILRNLNKEIIALATKCTHRGCEVRALPDSFQCPCHGSEYDEFGEVLEGPATDALQRFQVLEQEHSYLIQLDQKG